MIIQIYHAKNPTFHPTENPEVDIIGCLHQLYNNVGAFESNSNDTDESLESVYCASQNIDKAWCEPPCRSTSVGDVLVVTINEHPGQVFYEVAPFGFNKIN